ncbi:hypothetical protein [Actinoplanes sp. TFC3]|uniref:hypothetical protein n=1 Tax=Actinoplanes sp. TFC3 TaxID=1710355 RepID=UPI000835A224|nr:hypothetical protein [Actinoplanes sp. TFC3]
MRRRFIATIAVLTGLFGLGATSANAAGRVSASDKAGRAVVTQAVTPCFSMKACLGCAWSMKVYSGAQRDGMFTQKSDSTTAK